MQEKTIQSKQCRFCNSSFDITDLDLEFYKKVSPIFAWKKYLIPTPTICPDCRQQRRLSFRNERNLYRRKCDLTGKDIISIYSPDKPYKVYGQDAWWSDKWDAMDYARDFDFSRWFFGQFDELMKQVPQLWLLNTDNENAEYNNYIKWCKDAYMSSVVYYECENIYYSNWIFHSKNIYDSFSVYDSEIIFESFNLKWCFRCFYINNSFDSTNCYFSRHLRWCKNCIFCTNLVNKEYFAFNKKCSKDEFEYIKNKYLNWKYIDLQKAVKEFLDFSSKQFFPNLNLSNCENSFWDNLFDSKNCFYCFDTSEIEDSKWISAEISKICYDWIWWTMELSYEFCRCWWWQRNIFTFDWIESNDVILSASLYSCNNCFWCVWLRNKQYCILNKQYSKQEYEELVPKIIEHMMKPLPPRLRGTQGESEWWEFFPSSISPFGYNETVAMDYFPVTPPLTPPCEGGGFNWSTYISPFPKTVKIIPAEKLPDNIKDVPNDILAWAIECEITKKPFRIIKQELEFYRKFNLPIPKRHQDTRHLERMELRNPRKLFDRKCDKCGVTIQTTFAPERKEIVYCEKCYEKEVY